jgi:tetratricopeptide (TPR) repeat protein
MVLEELGAVATGQGDLVIARSYGEQALGLAEQQGNKRALAAANNALAQLCRMEGDLDTAETLYEKMLTLSRSIEDRETIATGLLNLAMVAIGRGLFKRANGLLIEALALAEEIGSKRVGQSGLEVVAGLGAARKEWGTAAGLFGAAEAQMAQSGLYRDPADEAFVAPLVASACAALGTTAFAAARTTGGAWGYDDAMVRARTWLESWC